MAQKKEIEKMPKPIFIKTDEPIYIGVGLHPLLLSIGLIGWAILIGIFIRACGTG